jgi:hypothetical protein
MPRPTIAPLVLAVGITLLAAGWALGTAFMIVGAAILVAGLGMWVGQMLPGRGHFHETFVAAELRAKPIMGQPGGVEREPDAVAGTRLRMPEAVHPISAGIRGGIIAGLVMPIPALIYGLLRYYALHNRFSIDGLWYPVNLLAGMAVPGVSEQALEEFHFGLFVTAVIIHAASAVTLGLIYGVLLPTLPEIPQSMAWAALLAPLAWTGATFITMGLVSPGLRGGVSWPWFLLSQFIYGIVMALVVTQATDLRPIVRGIAGGALGGLLMPLPAILWSLGTGRGIWYPVNLLAGMLVPGLNDPKAPTLRQFHADWLALGLLAHAVVSLGFAVACALLLPKLRRIPSPLAWGGLIMPLLWTGASYSLMRVVNPLLEQKVDWPAFIVSQFVFGIVASIVVVRAEMVYITPAGHGPDRVPLTGSSGARAEGGNR